MRGPGLTTVELMAYLRYRIQRFERLGLSREAAIRAAALDDGIDEQKLRSLLGTFDASTDVIGATS